MGFGIFWWRGGWFGLGDSLSPAPAVVKQNCGKEEKTQTMPLAFTNNKATRHDEAPALWPGQIPNLLFKHLLNASHLN